MIEEMNETEMVELLKRFLAQDLPDDVTLIYVPVEKCAYGWRIKGDREPVPPLEVDHETKIINLDRVDNWEGDRLRRLRRGHKNAGDWEARMRPRIIFHSLGILAQISIFLKFLEVITWSWYWALSPAFVLALALVGLFLWHLWAKIGRQAQASGQRGA
jgi:hypothetical protein